MLNLLKGHPRTSLPNNQEILIRWSENDGTQVDMICDFITRGIKTGRQFVRLKLLEIDCREVSTGTTGSAKVTFESGIGQRIHVFRRDS